MAAHGLSFYGEGAFERQEENSGREGRADEHVETAEQQYDQGEWHRTGPHGPRYASWDQGYRSGRWDDWTWGSESDSTNPQWWRSWQEPRDEGQWFWTPRGWFWGKNLDAAVENAIQRQWIQVDREFLGWWSESSAGGSTERHSGSESNVVGNDMERGERFSDGGEGASEVASKSEVEGSSGKESSSEKKPNMGKDFVPIHDGALSMREYERRVRLFQATTSIDVEFQGGRLVEKLQGDAWAAVETLDMNSLRSPRGVEILLQHLWGELEPLEYLRVMQTLSHFFKTFRRGRGEEFTHYDTAFRAQCLRLTESGSPLTGVAKAYWFLEKASISEELRRSVIASAGGQYDYEKLRAALCAIVPQVHREHQDQSTSQQKGGHGGRWPNHGRHSHKVHAVVADGDDAEPAGEPEEGPSGEFSDEELAKEIEDMETEAQILMTQAAKRRSEAMKNRGFQRNETGEQREARIKSMKAKMACAACRSHGIVSYGHWHSDDACPFKGKEKDKDTTKKPQVSDFCSDSIR